MSRIQAAFDALGRELLDSEKPAVAAFRAKYSRKNTEAHSSVAAATAEAIAKALALGDAVTFDLADVGMSRGYRAFDVEDALILAVGTAGMALRSGSTAPAAKPDNIKE